MPTGTAPARIEVMHKAAPVGKRTIIIRLPQRVSLTLRSSVLAHGDMACAVETSLRRVDLDRVQLLDLREEREFGNPWPTTINIDHCLHQTLKEVAKRRMCSMNLLISSTLAEHLRHLRPSVTISSASRVRRQRETIIGK